MTKPFGIIPRLAPRRWYRLHPPGAQLSYLDREGATIMRCITIWPHTVIGTKSLTMDGAGSLIAGLATIIIRGAGWGLDTGGISLAAAGAGFPTPTSEASIGTALPSGSIVFRGMA